MKKKDKIKVSDALLDVRLRVDRIKSIVSVISEDPDILNRSEADDQLLTLLKGVKKDLKHLHKLIDK